MSLTLTIWGDREKPADPQGHDPLRRVLGALERRICEPRQVGDGSHEARCPVHKGSRRNLTIDEGGDGKVLLYCHHADASGQGCTFEAIVAALDLRPEDLFVPDLGRRGPKARTPKKPKAPGQPERINKAHKIVSLCRRLFTYGVAAEIPDCARLIAILDATRFKQPGRRRVQLERHHVEAFIVAAIDDIDSKINTIAMFIKGERDATAGTGEKWSRFNQLFERYFLLKP